MGKQKDQIVWNEKARCEPNALDMRGESPKEHYDWSQQNIKVDEQ